MRRDQALRLSAGDVPHATRRHGDRDRDSWKGRATVTTSTSHRPVTQIHPGVRTFDSRPGRMWIADTGASHRPCPVGLQQVDAQGHCSIIALRWGHGGFAGADRAGSFTAPDLGDAPGRLVEVRKRLSTNDLGQVVRARPGSWAKARGPGPERRPGHDRDDARGSGVVRSNVDASGVVNNVVNNVVCLDGWPAASPTTLAQTFELLERQPAGLRTAR